VPSLSFEIREKYRHGWSNAGFPSPAGPTGDWWLVVDYRGGDLFHAPVDSIEGAATFGGARVRAVLDTMLPTSIRVLKLVPAVGDAGTQGLRRPRADSTFRLPPPAPRAAP